MKSTLNITILMASLLFTFSSSSFSQAGTLDSSFGVNGTGMTSLNPSEIIFTAASAIQQDGKIVVAVLLYYPDFLLIRYHANGNVDSSFGINGQVKAHFDGYPSHATALAIQEDGKIIVTGSTADFSYLLARFLPNGNLDSAFGLDGKVITKPFNDQSSQEPHAIAVQSNGKILVGGGTDNSYLIQHKSNGEIDSSFGTDGQIKYVLGNRVDDIAIDTDGKIVVASKEDVLATYRLLPDGAFDSTFGNNGKAITSFSNYSYSLPNSIVILKDHSIIEGDMVEGSNNMALVKYKPNGDLDSSFGTNGRVISSLGLAVVKVLVQKDEKLIAAVAHSLEHDNSFVSIRFNSNGMIDSTFGDNGIATAPFENHAYLLSAALQQDGKIISVGVLGYSDTSNIYLARFKGDEPSVSIQKNISTLEGNSGTTTPVTFKIVLNKPSTQTIKVHYATKDGKAKAGSDYVATSGTLTFRPGQVSKKVVVNVIGDNVVETNEKFSLQLSNPQNAILGILSTATCTIKNDDPSFASAGFVEDNSSANKTNIALYPNPVKDVLKVKGLSANNKTTISVIDVEGKVVMKATTSNVSTSLNVKQLQAGTYLVKIETNNTTTTLKFVKE